MDIGTGVGVVVHHRRVLLRSRRLVKLARTVLAAVIILPDDMETPRVEIHDSPGIIAFVPTGAQRQLQRGVIRRISRRSEVDGARVAIRHIFSRRKGRNDQAVEEQSRQLDEHVAAVFLQEAVGDAINQHPGLRRAAIGDTALDVGNQRRDLPESLGRRYRKAAQVVLDLQPLDFATAQTGKAPAADFDVLDRQGRVGYSLCRHVAPEGAEGQGREDKDALYCVLVHKSIINDRGSA